MIFRFLRILALAAILPLSAEFAAAQTQPAAPKAETSLYTKTMAKPSVKAADKFLKKYPESVYAQKVLNLKDSLLTAEFIFRNVSHISKETALQKAGAPTYFVCEVYMSRSIY